MTETTPELNDHELDALIERIQQAIEHQLALSSDDLRLLLHALLMLSQLQERLADQDITLHKLRKLAGIVQRSEQLKDLVPASASELPKKKNRRRHRPWFMSVATTASRTSNPANSARCVKKASCINTTRRSAFASAAKVH
jgi:hypothetical protein